MVDRVGDASLRVPVTQVDETHRSIRQVCFGEMVAQ